MADVPADQQNELLFMQVVMMFQGMAMQNLGKVMNPVTNQIERNLEQAKNMIDLLGMLEAKTEGNLNENEKRLLDHALYELRMNYVDEIGISHLEKLCLRRYSNLVRDHLIVFSSKLR